ncbi:serine/threonine transporter SstT [Raoultibacter timonensis]|uniref:serine/threonine transporter SstT n=1 Tax=Raoultibacter timonensis TaxID=1907662 RepID=UPI001FD2E829|nr:serine/threonine transporter SstT [Raoultibacter timonensis]
MKELLRKYNDISLIKRIVVGLVIGAALGVFFPGIELITLLGSLFVSALKAVAPILVFFLVISALANARSDGSMKTVVVLYVISTLVAALVAVAASFLFPLTLTLTEAVDQSSPSGIGEVLTTVIMNVVDNPVNALMSANYVGILAWAAVLGIALRIASESTKGVFTSISDAVSQVVRWVIGFAPFGILGLVYTSVSTSGLEIFTEYGQLLLVLVGCMIFIALVTNPLIVFLGIRKNPYPLVLRCLKDSGITAFFTRSSAANIPVNMELCRKLGLDKDNYSVSIPLGATINMAGAAVTIAVMTMAAANTLDIAVDLPTAVILCVLAAVSAWVPRRSFLTRRHYERT